MFKFVLNFKAASLVMKNLPSVGGTTGFGSSGSIYWQLNLIFDTIFSICPIFFVKSFTSDFIRSRISIQFDLPSAVSGMPKSVSSLNSTLFSLSLQFFYSY